MLIEIKVALNFLLSFLYDKLPRRRVNLFGDEVEKHLKHKLTTSNRASPNFHLTVRVNKQAKYVDPIMTQAAKDSAMDIEEIVEQLPIYLKIYICAGKVAYRQCTGACSGIECKYCSCSDYVAHSDDDELQDAGLGIYDLKNN